MLARDLTEEQDRLIRRLVRLLALPLPWVDYPSGQAQWVIFAAYKECLDAGLTEYANLAMTLALGPPESRAVPHVVGPTS